MEAPTQFTQDQDKVIEAVIYMAEQSKDDSYFGERKVYKLLYSVGTESGLRAALVLQCPAPLVASAAEAQLCRQ